MRFEEFTAARSPALLRYAMLLGVYLPTDRSRALRRQPEPSPVIGWRDPGGS